MSQYGVAQAESIALVYDDGGDRVLLDAGAVTAGSFECTSHSTLEWSIAMTAARSINPEQFLHEQLAQASPDLMREMLATFINALLSAQADAVCGAEYRTRSPERDNRRSGYRHPGPGHPRRHDRRGDPQAA